MYRFRTIENLLGKHKELENQEIYFAPSDALNDPMEGLLDVFWQGDAIVWKFFLKHYLACFERIFMIYSLSGEEYDLTHEDIPLLNPYRFPTKEYSILYDQIEAQFFKFDFISKLPLELASRKNKVERDELYTYLKTVHAYALEAIIMVYQKEELIERRQQSGAFLNLDNYLVHKPSLIKLMNEAETSFPKIKNLSSKFYSAAIKTLAGFDFVKLLWDDHLTKNRKFIFYYFPDVYITKIVEIVHPKWYTACFMADCSNSSVWGHYGDKHEGVCLKFKTYRKDDSEFIDLKREYGYSKGPIKGMVPHEFHKVTYENKHVAIDFFRSIGMFTVGLLERMWYTDDDGNLSSVADSITPDKQKKEQWIDNYWKNFYQGATTKLTDWSYEKEYRLLLNNMFRQFDTFENRKVVYDFKDLEGIIFGIKTSLENKAKIVKIIKAKCEEHGRNDFLFYQAYFSKESGKIEHELLTF